MIAQFIFNQLVDSKKSKSTIEKFFKLCREYLLKKEDPIINFTFQGYKIKIHLSHYLPIILNEHPNYNQNLADISQKLFIKYPDLKIIDVGANIGDSVVMIRSKVEVPILCIEGNPKFLDLLKHNTKNISDIYLADYFVGEESDNVLPINRIGTAHLIKANEEGIAVKTMRKVIEEFDIFANSKLLKIDTDGYDNKIIRGSKEFLIYSKAAVFFEYDPYFLSKQEELGFDIFDFFVSLNYRKFIIFDNIGEKLITLTYQNRSQFLELHSYFNQGGKKYMDILALHEEDFDLI